MPILQILLLTLKYKITREKRNHKARKHDVASKKTVGLPYDPTRKEERYAMLTLYKHPGGSKTPHLSCFLPLLVSSSLGN